MATQRGAFAALAAVSVAAVGIALFTQYLLDMQPCPWCVLQRLQFVAIAVVALLALAGRGSLARVAGGAAVLLLAASGVAAATWQHSVASKSPSCDLTLADRIVSNWLQLDRLLPSVFQVGGNCADAAVKLLGVPYELWSLALFALIAIFAARLALRRAND